MIWDHICQKSVPLNFVLNCLAATFIAKNHALQEHGKIQNSNAHGTQICLVMSICLIYRNFTARCSLYKFCSCSLENIIKYKFPSRRPFLNFPYLPLSLSNYASLSLGNSQGKNQPDGVLKGDRPYLIAPFRDGEKVTFHIPPSDNNLQYSK